jgi:rubrerythrin
MIDFYCGCGKVFGNLRGQEEHVEKCEMKAQLDAALLAVSTKDKALELCVAVLRSSRDYGAEEAEAAARAALIEKRSDEPLYLCKNCGRHHWEGPKDCPV